MLAGVLAAVPILATAVSKAIPKETPRIGTLVVTLTARFVPSCTGVPAKVVVNDGVLQLSATLGTGVFVAVGVAVAVAVAVGVSVAAGPSTVSAVSVVATPVMLPTTVPPCPSPCSALKTTPVRCSGVGVGPVGPTACSTSVASTPPPVGPSPGKVGCASSTTTAPGVIVPLTLSITQLGETPVPSGARSGCSAAQSEKKFPSKTPSNRAASNCTLVGSNVSPNCAPTIPGLSMWMLTLTTTWSPTLAGANPWSRLRLALAAAIVGVGVGVAACAAGAAAAAAAGNAATARPGAAPATPAGPSTPSTATSAASSARPPRARGLTGFALRPVVGTSWFIAPPPRLIAECLARPCLAPSPVGRGLEGQSRPAAPAGQRAWGDPSDRREPRGHRSSRLRGHRRVRPASVERIERPEGDDAVVLRLEHGLEVEADDLAIRQIGRRTGRGAGAHPGGRRPRQRGAGWDEADDRRLLPDDLAAGDVAGHVRRLQLDVGALVVVYLGRDDDDGRRRSDGERRDRRPGVDRLLDLDRPQAAAGVPQGQLDVPVVALVPLRVSQAAGRRRLVGTRPRRDRRRVRDRGRDRRRARGRRRDRRRARGRGRARRRRRIGGRRGVG